MYYTLLMTRPEFSDNLEGQAKLIGEVVATAIRRVTQLPIWVEAPNDLMIESKKIGGILMEAKDFDERPIIIVGVGLNVNQTSFSEDIAWRATSLQVVSHKKWDIMGIVAAVTKELTTYLLG
jgi:BirA family biotin operon repressor/biotin-[acetyl-CoA-carboxylase] ligase